jgi:hypothetical protein
MNTQEQVQRSKRGEPPIDDGVLAEWITEVNELKAELRENKIITTLEKKKAELEKELATGEKAVKEGKVKPEESARIKVARQEVKDLKKEIADKKASERKESSKQRAIEKERKTLEARRDKAKARLKDGPPSGRDSSGRVRRRTLRKTPDNQKIQDEIDELDKQIKEKESAERKEQKRFETLSDQLAKAEKELETGIKEEGTKKAPSPEMSQRNEDTKQRLAEVDAKIKEARAKERKELLEKQKVERREKKLASAEAEAEAVDGAKTLDERLKILNNGNVKKPQPRKALSNLRTKKAIAKIDKQLETGNIDIEEKPPRVEVTKEEALARYELQQKKLALQELITEQERKAGNDTRTAAERAIDVAHEAGQLFRGPKLSGDYLGAGFRQLILQAVNIFQPSLMGKTWQLGAKSLLKGLSAKGAVALQADLERNIYYADAIKHGWRPRSPDEKISGTDELTQSKWLDKLKIPREYIASNDRVMSSWINATSLHAYASHMQRSRNPTKEEKKWIINHMMTSAGRGTLLSADKWGKMGNLLFLSARFAIGTVQAPHQAAFGMLKVKGSGLKTRIGLSSENQRNYIIRTWGGFLATGVAVTVSLASTPWFDIDDDPDSATFGKLIHTSGRVFSPWGPYYAVARIYWRSLATMMLNAGVRNVGNIRLSGMREFDALDEGLEFMKNRTSPLASLITNIARTESKYPGIEITDIFKKVSREKKIDTGITKAIVKGDMSKLAETTANTIALHSVPIIAEDTLRDLKIRDEWDSIFTIGLSFIGIDPKWDK